MCSVKKDIKQIIRRCSHNGWTIERTGGDHLKWQHKNGFFFSASSPSDKRMLLKIKKQVAAMEAGRPNIGR